VGTSRREETLSGVIFSLLWELGFSAKALTGKNIMALKTVQPAVAEIKGYSLYHVSRLDAEGHPDDDSLIEIVKREGVAARMSSRAEGTRKLMGSKRTIVHTGQVYVGFGKTDGATIIIIPILGSDFQVDKLLLLHVGYREDLTAAEKKEALGYRYNDIRNLINEYNLPWTDDYLQALPMATLLGETIEAISDLIRKDLENRNEEH